MFQKRTKISSSTNMENVISSISFLCLQFRFCVSICIERHKSTFKTLNNNLTSDIDIVTAKERMVNFNGLAGVIHWMKVILVTAKERKVVNFKGVSRANPLDESNYKRTKKCIFKTKILTMSLFYKEQLNKKICCFNLLFLLLKCRYVRKNIEGETW